MDKLEAANLCLSSVGLAPLNSLDGGDPDGARASTKIDQVSKRVQSSGWSFNSDYKVTLALDVNGKVPVPDNAITVSAKGYNPGLARVSVRTDPVDGTRRLWDVGNQTWVFTAAPQVDLVYFYDFADLPDPVQEYVAARAAREWQEDHLGAGTVDRFLLRREEEAYGLLLDAEDTEEDLNVLKDNDFCRLVTSRYDTFYGF